MRMVSNNCNASLNKYVNPACGINKANTNPGMMIISKIGMRSQLKNTVKRLKLNVCQAMTGMPPKTNRQFTCHLCSAGKPMSNPVIKYVNCPPMVIKIRGCQSKLTINTMLNRSSPVKPNRRYRLIMPANRIHTARHKPAPNGSNNKNSGNNPNSRPSTNPCGIRNLAANQ